VPKILTPGARISDILQLLSETGLGNRLALDIAEIRFSRMDITLYKLKNF
jgi:hypothetical protein